MYECVDRDYVHINGTNVNLDFQRNGPGPWPLDAAQSVFTCLWQICSGTGSIGNSNSAVSFVTDTMPSDVKRAEMFQLFRNIFARLPENNWDLFYLVHKDSSPSTADNIIRHEIAGERNRIRMILVYKGTQTKLDEIPAIELVRLAHAMRVVLMSIDVNLSSFLFSEDLLLLQFAESFEREIGNAVRTMTYFVAPSQKRGIDEVDEENKICSLTLPELCAQCVQCGIMENGQKFSCQKMMVDLHCTLSCDQRLALFLAVQRRENMFITGSAGTGKSTVTKLIFTELKMRGRVVAMTATTGRAGSLVSGSTLHSWAGIGLGEGTVDFLLSQIYRMGQSSVYNVYLQRWTQTDVLFIDEISMLKPELFQKLHEIGMAIRRRPNMLFGGMQIIEIGDFFQLAPVYKKRVPSDKCYCFQHTLWKQGIPFEIELCKVFRQQNVEFVDLLNAMRRGSMSDKHFALLRNRLLTNNPELLQDERYKKSTRLYARKLDAQEQNQRQMYLLPPSSETHAYECVISFSSHASSSGQRDKLQKLMENIVPVDSSLQIKIGMRVLCAANVDQDAGIINGAAGIVTGFGWPEKNHPYVTKTVHKHNLDYNGELPLFYAKCKKENKPFPIVSFDHDPSQNRVVCPHTWEREDEHTRSRMRSSSSASSETQEDCEQKTQNAYELVLNSH